MIRFFLLSAVLFTAFACKNTAKEQPTESTTPASPAPAAATVSYPSVPLDTLQMLWEKCDYIDYIFYGRNFSMNQSEQAAIRAALSHISDEVPTINPACQPTGHLFYQVEGENRLEADLYFQQQCVYFVFYDQGKPAFANKMTPQGLNFFQQVFQSQQGGSPLQ